MLEEKIFPEKDESTSDEDILDLILSVCEKCTFSNFADLKNFADAYRELRETIYIKYDILDLPTDDPSNIFESMFINPPKIVSQNDIIVYFYDEGCFLQGAYREQPINGFIEQYKDNGEILSYILLEMSLRKETLQGQIMHIKEKQNKNQLHLFQKKIQASLPQISGMLLLPAGEKHDITGMMPQILSNNQATPQDFGGKYFSTDQYSVFIYAEKGEYLANIALGFDPVSGKIMTDQEKLEHFNQYFSLKGILDDTYEDEDGDGDGDGDGDEDGDGDGDGDEDGDGDGDGDENSNTPNHLSPSLLNDNPPTIQRIQMLDISKLDPSSSLYKIIAPLADNIKTILSNVEIIENNMRIGHQRKQYNFHENKRFLKLHEKRIKKYGDKDTLDDGEIFNTYEKEVLGPLKNQFQKIRQQSYRVCINEVCLPQKINKTLRELMGCLEEIALKNNYRKSIEKGWKLLGKKGQRFFNSKKNIDDQYDKDVLILGKEILGENFTTLPKLGPRSMIDIYDVAMRKIKKEPGWSFDDIWLKIYGNALKAEMFVDPFFRDPQNKYYKEEDINTFVDASMQLLSKNKKETKDLYESSPFLLAQLAFNHITGLLKKQFSLTNEKELASLVHETFLGWIAVRIKNVFGTEGQEEYEGKKYNTLAISWRFIIEQGNFFLERYHTSIDINAFLKIVEKELPLNVLIDLLELLSDFHEQFDKARIASIIDNKIEEKYTWGSFSVGYINLVTYIQAFSRKYNIPLRSTPYSPLEQYAIHRIRRPESVGDHYMNEYSYNRDEGTIGYGIGDLGDTDQLLQLLQDVGSPLTLKNILSIDYRPYANIPLETWIDINENVPIQVGMPFVNVVVHSFRDQNKEACGRYLLTIHPDTKQYKLIIDSTVKNAAFLQDRHAIYDEIILGGGRAHLFYNKGAIELSGREFKFGSEPRILSATACVNAFNKALPLPNSSRKIFLGDDGYVRHEDYLG